MSLTPSSPSGKGAGMNRIFDRSEIMKAATDLCDKVEFVEESIQEIVAERDELRAKLAAARAVVCDLCEGDGTILDFDCGQCGHVSRWSSDHCPQCGAMRVCEICKGTGAVVVFDLAKRKGAD